LLLFFKTVHPIFYGCFDWHSAVHSHWLLASLLGRFPKTALAQKIIHIFDEQFKVRRKLPILVNGLK